MLTGAYRTRPDLVVLVHLPFRMSTKNSDSWAGDRRPPWVAISHMAASCRQMEAFGSYGWPSATCHPPSAKPWACPDLPLVMENWSSAYMPTYILTCSDRPNPVSAEPNRTIFLPNYSSAKTAERVRQMVHISAERSVRFGFCRTCSGFGRSLAIYQYNMGIYQCNIAIYWCSIMYQTLV